MRVRMLQDYRGQHTGEQFYLNGAEVDLPPSQAAGLIRDGRAKAIDTQGDAPGPGPGSRPMAAEPPLNKDKPEPAPPPKPGPKRRTRKKKAG